MKRIGEHVAGELARFGPSGAMPRVVELWRGVVGTTIARNAWPARISRDRTLHVHTSSSAWAFELAQLEPEIRGRLSAALGGDAPRGLRFAVGRLPEPGRDDKHGRRSRPPEPTAAELVEAAELAAVIEDGELRKLVAKAAAQSLASSR